LNAWKTNPIFIPRYIDSSRRPSGHVLAIEVVRARGGLVEAAQHVHQGGLARARGAHDRDVLPEGDVQVHAPQGLDHDRPVGLVVDLGDPAELADGRGLPAHGGEGGLDLLGEL
jgi:hypothetical protein